MFTVVLPSGTPLPARRHHIMSGTGKLSSLCLDIYQRFVTEQPEKLAKVKKSSNTESDVEPHTALPCLHVHHNFQGFKSDVSSVHRNGNNQIV